MSLKRLLDTLVSLGLTRTEAQAYVLLAEHGPYSGKELASALRITKQKLYCSLRRLQAKKMVTVAPPRLAQFSAVSLEKVLELYMKTMVEQAKALQANRKELLESWRSAIEWDSRSS